MDELIKWYMALDGFSQSEKELLGIPRKDLLEPVPYDERYKALMQEYFNRMPFCNINSDNRYITFDESGTAFIDEIFKNEVDDKTLVISTNYEHTSVQKQLVNVKNKILLNTDELRKCDFGVLLKGVEKFKKVFVYVIGTQLCTGEITPQIFFEGLKSALVNKNIPHKIMIDDVHGMFLIPRDYRLFDYVLYTAHALVNEYDMGMLISKDKIFGKYAYDWAEEYLKRLNIVLKRKSKMFLFKNILTEYFSDLLVNSDIFRQYTQTTQHIFAVETKGIEYTEEERDILDSYEIAVSAHPMYLNWLRIRFQEFSRLDLEKAVEGLHYLGKLLEKRMYICRLKGNV